MTLSLEVAVFSGAQGLSAQALGAKRIELNAPGSYDAGGLTPPVSALTSIASQLEIPVRIMIRPRGPPQINTQKGGEGEVGGPEKKEQKQPEDIEEQDFIYSDDEFALMLQSIADFKASRVMNPCRGDGFVFGVLKRQGNKVDQAEAADDGRFHQQHDDDHHDPGDDDAQRLIVDEARCRALINAARPFGCVFHRAFDPIAASKYWYDGLRTIMFCGFEGLLTAGGAGAYCDNVSRLDQMCRRSVGYLQVIVGGGLRHHNVAGPAARLSVHGAKTVWMHTASLSAARLAVAAVGEEDRALREKLDDAELLKILAQLSLTKPD